MHALGAAIRILRVRLIFGALVTFLAEPEIARRSIATAARTAALMTFGRFL